MLAGDFMRGFSLDRRYEELQTVTELAHNLEVSFPLSEAVADVYRQAVRRYGSADGELLTIALLEQQAPPDLFGLGGGCRARTVALRPGYRSRSGRSAIRPVGLPGGAARAAGSPSTEWGRDGDTGLSQSAPDLVPGRRG
jgi:hypothetical protein